MMNETLAPLVAHGLLYELHETRTNKMRPNKSLIAEAFEPEEFLFN
jgi:hypothetical protein